MFAEIVFARPGVGKLIYDAVLARNYPIVMGAVLVTTALFVICTLVADLGGRVVSIPVSARVSERRADASPQSGAAPLARGASGRLARDPLGLLGLVLVVVVVGRASAPTG